MSRKLARGSKLPDGGRVAYDSSYLRESVALDMGKLVDAHKRQTLDRRLWSGGTRSASRVERLFWPA